MKNIVLLSIFSICMHAGFAQYFIQSLESEDITGAKYVYAITNYGDSIAGKVAGATLINGELRKISIKDESGIKHKFAASDITRLGAKLTKLHQITAAYSASSIKQLIEQPSEEIMNREWAHFEQVLLPKKKNKFALLQLLNDGFDSKPGS